MTSLMQSSKTTRSSAVHMDADYTTEGGTYHLTSKGQPAGSLWLSLPRHSPVARIELLTVPDVSPTQRLQIARTLLDEARVIARRSKARTIVRINATPQIVDLLRQSGFKRFQGVEYTSNLYPDVSDRNLDLRA